MADLKISQLPASTTPLAGTEAVPIVQSGVTKQVSVANLTAGRAVSAASMTLSTGNLAIGTSGQGVDFSATPGTGTSELFSDYEEGTWTPVLSAATVGDLTVAYSSQVGFYTKIGRMVTVNFFITTSTFTRTTASGDLRVTGLPFTALSTTGSFNFGATGVQGIQKANYTQVSCAVLNNSTLMVFPTSGPASGQNYDNVAITDIASGNIVILRGTVSYIV